MKPKYERWLTPSGLIDLEELAYNCGGITALQVKLGIGQSTMHRWREHIEIDEAIERGLSRANKKVEPLPALIEKPKVLEDMLAWCDPLGVMA